MWNASSVPAYRSVREFVKDFKAKNIPCHMLFNNAGEWIRPDGTYTEEGFQVSSRVLSSVCSAFAAEAWPLLNHAVVFLKMASFLRSCSLAMQIMIGVQHFAHFYLTLLLVDKMKESTSSSTPTRIVFTTSASEATGQADIPWDNLG